MRQIYSLIFRSTDLQIGQTERANLLNKSINGGRRPRPLLVLGGSKIGPYLGFETIFTFFIQLQ